jgi:AAA family ATP:ADP antiporter
VLAMKTWVERALNLRPGDLRRGLYLCGYLFLVISSVVVGKVARDALFLTRFKAVQLPYVDIATALLVGVVVAVYVRIGRWASLRNLLLGSLLFFSASCTFFWALAHYYHPIWLFPVFYVWAGMFGVLAPTQVWTLANYVMTTREAKRIFGIVGGGAIAGWIFAGFFSKTVAKWFGTESLLLGMALFLVVCPVLVFLIWRSGQVQLGTEEGAQAESNQPRTLLESMRLVFSSPYLRAIAAVICVSSFVVTLTGWQLKAIAKHYFVGKDALAIFFGNFYLYAGVVALILQLLLTGRCLRRFGIGVALFMLPMVVLLGSAGVLAFGTLMAIVMLKGTEQVLRYSIDKSTSELLYLPVSARLKMQAKWFIDTVMWRMGDGLAGVTVLILATYLHMTARQLSAVVLLLVGAWLLAVFVARQQYVATLKESIRDHRLDAEQASAPVLDRSTADVLAAKLLATDPQEILYALRLFEVERQRAAHPVVRGLLDHPAAEVRQKALALLAASGDKVVLPQVQGLLRDVDLNVRTEALLYLTHHAHIDPLQAIEELGDFPDFSVRSAVVAYLARPGEAQNVETARTILETMVGEHGAEGQRARLEAARLLAALPDVFDPLLSMLLTDCDIEVVREAVRSTGRLRKRRLVPELLDRLADERVASEAAGALVKFGDTIVGGLRDHLGDTAVPIRARREIPGILRSIGTATAQQVLMENLLERDTTLRSLIIGALNKLRRVHPEVEIDTQLLETVLAAEILGHYRSYQILHMLGAAAETDDAVARGLRESMHQELERIFGLLGLLYPRIDVHSVYLGLQSKSASVYDNALEFLDNVLKSQLRNMLVPLLDGRIAIAERVRLANRLVRASIESPEQAVAALVSSDDPWLKSCGAYAIGALGMKTLEGELSHCLEHPDALLRETARTAKLRLGGLSQAAKVS